MFTDDLVTILVNAGVGLGNVSIFIGAKVALPAGPGPFLTIRETGGASPEGTHNLINKPAYVRPTAQIVTRAEDLVDARTMAQQAYEALFPIRNQFINGTWWRSITIVHEPGELGEDDLGRPRIFFNIECTKRLSPATS